MSTEFARTHVLHCSVFAHVRIHICTYVRICMYSYLSLVLLHSCIYSHERICIFTYVRAHIYVLIPESVLFYLFAYVRTYTHVCACMYARIYMSSYLRLVLFRFRLCHAVGESFHWLCAYKQVRWEYRGRRLDHMYQNIYMLNYSREVCRCHWLCVYKQVWWVHIDRRLDQYLQMCLYINSCPRTLSRLLTLLCILMGSMSVVED